MGVQQNTAVSGKKSNLRKLRKTVLSKTTYRGILAVIIFFICWEASSRLHFPIVGEIPPPSSVLKAMQKIVGDAGFWKSWLVSFKRVFSGFIVAQIIGIPLGLLMGINRIFRELMFPGIEILRPIPPLAWVPTAVIFWPTAEMSMTFVTFLGAFFTVVLNIIGGARSIDVRYLRAAYSLGSRRRDIFFRIVLPATLPSIFVGMAVGMGITWEVVVAAEMIASRSGLGFLTWQSYVAGNYPVIVIGMISIGVAGFLSSSLIRLIGNFFTPWRKVI
ncbi:MAG TPA: ABC transporter permease [Thermodesulfobacteriota bacterium]|nr:ABC transporter permease [Thermodesulfobacteriota bacterium]